MNETAYKIGYDAALNNGQCIFACNADAVKLLEGNYVGHKDNELIMKSFIAGVNTGSDELCKQLMEA